MLCGVYCIFSSISDCTNSLSLRDISSLCNYLGYTQGAKAFYLGESNFADEYNATVPSYTGNCGYNYVSCSNKTSKGFCKNCNIKNKNSVCQNTIISWSIYVLNFIVTN